MKTPNSLRKYLGPYSACVFDTLSGECVAWGHTVNRSASKEILDQLKEHGEMAYLLNNQLEKVWCLITRSLTIEEAINRYGKIKKIQVGSRGGYKTITFGNTTFKSRRLDPRKTKFFNKRIVEVVK
jgi:hypothetical protein